MAVTADKRAPGTVTTALVAVLRSARKGQNVSAQELADRMAALGYPIKRAVIAKIETGRRAEISVDYLAFAAKALGIDASTALRRAIGPCLRCGGTPPEGFTCNACGGAR